MCFSVEVASSGLAEHHQGRCFAGVCVLCIVKWDTMYKQDSVYSHASSSVRPQALVILARASVDGARYKHAQRLNALYVAAFSETPG